MVRILAVDTALAAACTAAVLRHEVRCEVDVGELARLVEVEARALESAVRMRGAVVELDCVSVGLVCVTPSFAIGREEM